MGNLHSGSKTEENSNVTKRRDERVGRGLNAATKRRVGNRKSGSLKTGANKNYGSSGGKLERQVRSEVRSGPRLCAATSGPLARDEFGSPAARGSDDVAARVTAIRSIGEPNHQVPKAGASVRYGRDQLAGKPDCRSAPGSRALPALVSRQTGPFQGQSAADGNEAASAAESDKGCRQGSIDGTKVDNWQVKSSCEAAAAAANNQQECKSKCSSISAGGNEPSSPKFDKLPVGASREESAQRSGGFKQLTPLSRSSSVSLFRFQRKPPLASQRSNLMLGALAIGEELGAGGGGMGGGGVSGQRGCNSVVLQRLSLVEDQRQRVRRWLESQPAVQQAEVSSWPVHCLLTS